MQKFWFSSHKEKKNELFCIDYGSVFYGGGGGGSGEQSAYR
jgi:hypothetical protein